MSRQRFLVETASTEVNDWVHFYEMKDTRTEPIHWYLAHIALMIYNIGHWFSRKWKKATMEDFLIKFKTTEDVQKPVKEELTDQQRMIRMQQSKAFWIGTIGKAAGQKKENPAPPRKPKDGKRVHARAPRRKGRGRD